MGLRDDIEKVQNKVQEIEKQSLAMELLKDYKRANKRLFIIIIIVLIMWFLTIGYLVYILNDIGTIKETNQQTIEDVDTIENSKIVNGDMYGENKTD